MRWSLAIAVLLAASACKDEVPPPASTGPTPVSATPRAPAGKSDLGPERSEGVGARAGEAEHDPSPTGQREESLAERPPADPEIERALDLITASGLRFIDVPDEPNERPSEYTAAQFASMLRTKWDWLGYGLIELEPWLDEIATRSFKTNLPYRVVLADGTQQEFRPWIDAQLRSSKPP
jgi:hypothetical protein